MSDFDFERLRNDVVPGVFPGVSFSALNLLEHLVAFDPRGIGGVIAFYPITTTPFTDAGMTGTLSESSLGVVGIFPLPSRSIAVLRTLNSSFSVAVVSFPTTLSLSVDLFPIRLRRTTTSQTGPKSIRIVYAHSPNADMSVIFFVFEVKPKRYVPRTSA